MNKQPQSMTTSGEQNRKQFGTTLRAWVLLLLFFPAVLAVNAAFMYLFPAKNLLDAGQSLVAQRANMMQLAHVYQTRKPNDIFAKFYYTLGVQMASRGQLISAEKLLEKAVSLEPENASVHLNYGMVLESLEKEQAALEAYEQAATLQPDLLVAHYNVGLLYDKLGKLDKGIEKLHRALAEDPDNAFVNYDLGVMYAKKNDYANSAIYSEVALRNQQDFAEAYNNYAYALAHLGRYDESLKAADKSLELKPDSAATLDTKGFALQGRGDTQAAIDMYQLALEKDPTIGEIYLHLGQCYETLKNYEKSIRAFESYLNLTPEAHDAEQVQKKIKQLKKLAKRNKGQSQSVDSRRQGDDAAIEQAS